MAQALGITEKERASVLHPHVKQTLGRDRRGKGDAARGGGSTNLLARPARRDRALVTGQLALGEGESLRTHPLLRRAGRAPAAGTRTALSPAPRNQRRAGGGRGPSGGGEGAPHAASDRRWAPARDRTHGRTAAALPGPASPPTRDVRGRSSPPEARRGPVRSPQPCGPGPARPLARNTPGDG